MSDSPTSLTKRLVWFSLAVLLAAWAIHTALTWLAEVWWGVLIVVVAIAAVVVGWRWWRSRPW